ncbi:phycobiliprotein lyase [Leptolyngbya sp. NK1-12]|uniref:Chromophore lyase CpcS/CpeS n=1 Tax=Leptolyngbya sp. NK1-12 TaxID=2547451 RepID=A0AA96WE05_9CYAN|nr:phycobiliprotein lyase [Leptolyngbya sp. NK1-12]
MNITEFFQQSVGKWVSQRSSHHLLQNQTENAKSDLMVEALAQDDPAVMQLCQQLGVDPAQVLCSLKMNWNGIVDRNPKPQVGSSLLVIVPDAADSNQGKLLRQASNSPKPMMGRYEMGDDEVLTLTSEAGDLYAEERIWFANPNFRLRTSAVKRNGNYTSAAFCSEIRLGGAAPAAKPAAAEAAN